MMIRHLATLVLLMGGLHFAAREARAQVRERVAAAMMQHKQFAPPACKALTSRSDRVRNGADELREGVRKDDPAQRAAHFAEAKRLLEEAVQQDSARAGATGWIYLGRTYLYMGDVVGADSAFARGQALSPDCEDDIALYREAAWVPLVNAGIDFMKAENADSALVVFRAANQIYRGKSAALSSLGVIYANKGENDSAAVYLKQAADAAAKTDAAEERNVATFNLGLVLARLDRHEEAIAAFEQYRQWVPNDSAVARPLAMAYRAAGQGDKAEALEKQYNLQPTATLSGKGTMLFNQAVGAFDAGNFAQAGALFDTAFTLQPHNHDALLNAATSYYRAKENAKLAAVADKLVALEPLNEIGLQLLAEAYRQLSQVDKQLAVVIRLRELPVRLETKGVAIGPTTVELTLAATGREAKDANDKVIPPAPVRVVFEGLGADGSVVVAEEVEVPKLEPGASHEFKASLRGSGIMGWRYTTKAS